MSSSRSHVTHDLQLLTNPALWLCAVAAVFTMATGAHAATTPDELSVPANVDNMTPKQAYEHDKAYCNSQQATEARSLCLKEAARAYQEARAGKLETGVVAQRDRGRGDNSAPGTTSTSGTSGASRARTDHH